jgi:hypothetical protein
LAIFVKRAQNWCLVEKNSNFKNFKKISKLKIFKKLKKFKIKPFEKIKKFKWNLKSLLKLKKNQCHV